MFQRDYLMRMVQQLAQALAAVFAGARGRSAVETRERLDTISRTFTGLNLDTLERLPYEHLYAAFTADGTLAVERAFAAARVLHARIEADLANGVAPSAVQAVTAYRLLADVAIDVGGFVDEHHERAFLMLHDGLVGAFADPEVAEAALEAFTAAGRFDKAEDVLFAWMDAEPAARTAAERFYRDLWARSDRELERGSLPRAEVEEGMRELGIHPGEGSGSG